MASVNKVILVGNLGADPETRYMPSGDAIANIRLATTFRWKDKEGQDRYTTEIMADAMQLLGSRAGAGEPVTAREPAEAASGGAAKPAAAKKAPAGGVGDMDDDIPF